MYVLFAVFSYSNFNIIISSIKKYLYQIMWAEAINKLEGMDSAERERLWPELVQGFKDLSRRLKVSM